VGLSLTFDNPQALLLFLLVPAFYLVGRLSSAPLARPARNAAIAVRLVVVSTLILALSQPVLHFPSNQLSVVFVVDRSASVTVKGASAADSWLQQALRHAGSNDHTSIVEFGKNTIVKRWLGMATPNANVPPVDPGQTNIAAALHLAATLLPPDGARRIVLLSDGQSNAGDELAQARQASSRDIQIDAVPIGPPTNFHEVLIESLSAPPSVRAGQPFDLAVVIDSTTTGNATLTFTLDDKPISQGQFRLRVGSNRFLVPLTLKVKGFHSFGATIAGAGDTYAQNNSAYAFTVVQDVGSVAVVASNPPEASAVVAALQAAGTRVTSLSPTQIPPNLSAMKSFDSIVVVDTPATAFTLDQMKTIAGFAHDLGHGVVFVGGPQSYGLGKYDGTPLSDALPLESGVPGNLQNGSAALVLVIDKSGSMDMDAGGVKKMTMADKSAQLATGLLGPSDDIGVVAFDVDSSWVVPLQRVGSESNRNRIENAEGQIAASGGTDIYTALQLAYQGIHQSAAQYKHIILMSDGMSLADADYTDLLNHIRDEKITLSTIAIGTDADKDLLQKLATGGGGSYYYVDNASMIPLITTKETRVVRGSSSADVAFQPQIAAPSPLLEGLSGADLPQLNGYVVTTAKHGATVALQSERRDPILADWNYGLGRVVAWASDASNHWAGNWLGWNQFARFWGQVVNWSMEAPGDPALQISSSVRDGVVDFVADIVNDQGAFQDLLDLRARVPDANGQITEVPLTQTRSGRYETTFSIAKPGAYPVEIVQYDATNKIVRDDHTGVVMSYPVEYRNFGTNLEELTSLTAVTGGRILQDPAEAFERSGISFAGQGAVPLWPLLLALAAILFPIDVAVRRLRIDPLDLAGRGWAFGWTSAQRGRAALGGWSQRIFAEARRALDTAR
jgi:uncharacterized membrane protein/Mg-chelatase subunit ChlD